MECVLNKVFPRGFHTPISLQTITKIPLIKESCNAELFTYGWCWKNSELELSAASGKKGSRWGE